MLKLKIQNSKRIFPQVARRILILVLVFAWIFSGWPPIFNFPPEVQEAKAVTLNSESFEGAHPEEAALDDAISSWDNVTGDDGEWFSDTNGATTSTGTGPDSVGAQDGTNFVFVETSASQPCISGAQTCLLEYESTFDAGTYDITVTFYTHMLGAQIGTLHLDVNDGGGWVSRWSVTGAQGDQWDLRSVDLSTWYTSGNINVRLRNVGNGSFAGDTSIDNIVVTGTTRNQITVADSGDITQPTGVDAGDNNVLMGAFTMIADTSSATVTSIKVSEKGTLIASSSANGLNNFKLKYKQEATCQSTTPSDATLFNTGSVSFDTSDEATVTGSMSVGTATQQCVYVETDIGSSASPGYSIELEITVSGDVSITSGSPTGSFPVQIVGTSNVRATTGTATSTEVDFDWVPGRESWGEVVWSTTEPAGTDVVLKVYYDPDNTPGIEDCDTIIPDGNLTIGGTANSTGFDVTDSPLDISGLNTTTYNRICLQATLTSNNDSPTLKDWKITWEPPGDAVTEAGGEVTGAGSGGGTPVTDGGEGGGEGTGGETPGFNPASDTGSPVGEWTNGSDAYTSDNSFTTSSVASQRQDYSDFGFSIPSGNQINGIEVKIEASVTETGGTIDIALSSASGDSYTTIKSTSSLTTSDVTYTLGDGSDTWGETWSPTNFSNANFRLRITAQPSSNTIQVDLIEVKVHHSATGGGEGGNGDPAP